MRLVGTNSVAAAHIMADNPGVNCPDAKSGAGEFMRSRLGGDSKLSYSIIFHSYPAKCQVFNEGGCHEPKEG